jgi:hypothetical protein
MNATGQITADEFVNQVKKRNVISKRFKPNANAVTIAIINHLRILGHFVYRTNNVGVWDAKKGVRRKLSAGSVKGVPDITGVSKSGQFIGIEVKTGRDKMSEFQLAFQEQTDKRGGIYLIAKSFDHFLQQWQQQPN